MEQRESLGLFPIDFALGSCKETIGLKNHKIIRQQIKKDDESRWDTLPTANDYFRAGHTLNYYPDKDQILVFGGYNGPQELYVLHNASSLETQAVSPTWEKVILDCKGRSGHISFILDHKLHIFGGYNDFGEVFQDMFTIDLQGNYEISNVQYKSASNFNLERRWHCSHYFDNNLLVHGGWNRSGALGDTLIYNMETEIWDSPIFEGTAPSPRRWHSLTCLKDKPQQFFIYGGYNGSAANPLNDFFLLDLEKQKWIQPSTKGKAPGPRNRHTFTPLNGNTTKEYVMLGGEQGEHRFNRTIYILHTDDMSWSCFENGALYAAIRASHRVDFMSTYGMVIGGGVVADYIEPFYYLDTRMLK